MMGRSKYNDLLSCLLAYIDRTAWVISEYFSGRSNNKLIPLMYLIRLEKIAKAGLHNCRVAGNIREDYWIEI